MYNSHNDDNIDDTNNNIKMKQLNIIYVYIYIYIMKMHELVTQDPISCYYN